MSGLPVYSTKQSKREQEIRNGANQILKALSLVETWKVSDLDTDLVCEFQRIAITQIYSCAGSLRDGPVSIQGVAHQPPHHSEVPALVQEMCDYVNSNWGMTAFHLSAYLMWRVNWIHPFAGGNGRTSRAVSYLA